MKYVRKIRGHYKGKSTKQGLTSAKDSAIELPEGHESPNHTLDKLTNLTYCLIYGPWGLIAEYVLGIYIWWTE